jgi:hypothetical protein
MKARSTLGVSTLVLASALSPAHAQTTSGSTPVVAIVKVPTPWYVPRSLVVSRMRDTVAQYEKLPGLAYKIYSISSDKKYGGIYLWKDAASAQAWFSPAWFTRVKAERGVEGQVTYYDAPMWIDNESASVANTSETVSTVVTISAPAGVSREQIIEGFRAAVPVYQKVPGLMRKYFIMTQDGKFGGIYLWANKAAAEQFYNETWKERVSKTYGAAANIEWFDAPILTPSMLAENRLIAAQK